MLKRNIEVDITDLRSGEIFSEGGKNYIISTECANTRIMCYEVGEPVQISSYCTVKVDSVQKMMIDHYKKNR